jgi:predicted nucleic acid-binding protein
MGMIVDSSVWVELERGNLTSADLDAATAKEAIYVAPPVLAELEFGVHRAKTPAQRYRRAAAVARVAKEPCLIIDQQTATIYGRLAADLDAGGRPHGHRIHDVWLAALALQHNLKVLTKNRKDFEGIPGLTVIVMPGQAAR